MLDSCNFNAFVILMFIFNSNNIHKVIYSLKVLKFHLHLYRPRSLTFFFLLNFFLNNLFNNIT
jgi:hypothetical protein